jgi:hypothetical protein
VEENTLVEVNTLVMVEKVGGAIEGVGVVNTLHMVVEVEAVLYKVGVMEVEESDMGEVEN